MTYVMKVWPKGLGPNLLLSDECTEVELPKNFIFQGYETDCTDCSGGYIKEDDEIAKAIALRKANTAKEFYSEFEKARTKCPKCLGSCVVDYDNNN
jgi:hypothetical protein